jgi:hypothetical protein
MADILREEQATARPEWVRHESTSWSWAALGWVSGFLGAAVVALFFLVIDLMAGRPLWTPAMLGSALFLGVPLAGEADSVLVLAAGYTAVHLGVFAGVGLITATALSVRPGKRPFEELLGIGIGLFAVFELSFWLFDRLFAPNLFSDLGAWRIAVANALAAAAMTAFFGHMADRLRAPMERNG